MVPVDDILNNLKESTFDQIAWNLAKLAIQQMTTSLVNWINSGFNGNPAFITDPLGFLGDIADQTLGEFIEGSAFGLLCSPFQVQIKMALILNQRNGDFVNKASCKLSDVLNNAQNYRDFVSFDFNTDTNSGYVGNWEDWYDVAVRPGGNLYSAYNIAEAEASLRISNNQFSYQKELDWGSGFLSWRDCSKASPGRLAGDLEINCPIVTPGSVISDQINHTLGLPQDTLVTADEFNEIISALLTQLLSQVFGPDGGLFGTTEPGFDFDGDSYLDSLYADAAASLDGTVGFSNGSINNTIDTLNEYISIKNQSIGKVNTTINLLKKIASACGSGSPQAANAASIITNTLNPMKAALEASIAKANEYIGQLEGFKTEIAVLDDSDTEGFSAILAKYNSLLVVIQPDSMVSLAQYERDTTVPNALAPINTYGQNTINSCTAASGGTTGTGGLGGGGGFNDSSGNH